MSMPVSLKKLGDDWHNPHPFEKLIKSIVPNASYTLMAEIERYLLAVYEAEHYGFKVYKDKSNQNIYDLDVQRYEEKLKLAKSDLKKEKDLLVNLSKKLEETIQEQRRNGFVCDYDSIQDQEEDDEDNDIYKGEKDVRISNNTKTKKNSKGEVNKRKQLEVQLATAVKNMYSSMETSKQKLGEYEEEVEMLEKKKEEFEKFRNASLYFQEALRRVVLKYEENKNLENLVCGIKDSLSQYNSQLKKT